jgi:hypothetical protein
VFFQNLPRGRAAYQLGVCPGRHLMERGNAVTKHKQFSAQYLVGWFLQEFADLEIEMEEALGWLLGLPLQSASILLRHLIIFRKIEAIRLLIPLVLDKEDAKRVDLEIKPIIMLNDEFRKEFAHTPFREQRDTGSIELLERFTAPTKNRTVVRVITQDEVVNAIGRIAAARRTLHDVVEIMAGRSVENMVILHGLSTGRGFRGVEDQIYSRLLRILSPG